MASPMQQQELRHWKPEDLQSVGAGLGCCVAGCRRTSRLLLCCVRLSPEKEPQRFVELAEALQARGALARLGLTPLLCASASGVQPPSWAALGQATVMQARRCTVIWALAPSQPSCTVSGLDTAISLCMAPARCGGPLVYTGLGFCWQGLIAQPLRQ